LRPLWKSGLAVSLSLTVVSVALAALSKLATEQVEQGYTHLTQARITTESAHREQLLALALASFKAAYQTEAAAALPATQAHALLGAAQAHVLIQSPRRVFPFLWQATPLQRAEKHLQQALVLQPDNAAASLLLGIVYERQAAQSAEPQSAVSSRGQYYLSQAGRLGIPLRMPWATSTPTFSEHGFAPEDTILALRYIDARGVGKLDDLLFVYRSVVHTSLFGVILVGQQAHPLRSVSQAEALAQQGALEAVATVLQPGQPPLVSLRLRQDTHVQEKRFLWNGLNFSPVPAVP